MKIVMLAGMKPTLRILTDTSFHANMKNRTAHRKQVRLNRLIDNLENTELWNQSFWPTAK